MLTKVAAHPPGKEQPREKEPHRSEQRTKRKAHVNENHQVEKERDRVEKQLKGIDAALTAFATMYRMPKRARRVISLAGRKRIAAAQRARWAKVRKQAKAS